MSLELCRMSLQQTRELLRLTDDALQRLCCRHFSDEELSVEAISKVLGGRGRRGPRSIFVLWGGRQDMSRRGRVFHLLAGEVVEGSETIDLEPSSVFAVPLLKDGVVSNWSDGSEPLDRYQDRFHPQVRTFVGAPISNFVTCRISGGTAGAILAFNYPGEATEYDADVLQGLAVVIGSLVTLSKEVRETEHAFVYTIEALARACEAAEEQTGEHIIRVNRYAGALAANMGLSTDLVEVISYSAQMHDVGKIRVPNSCVRLGPCRGETSETPPVLL